MNCNSLCLSCTSHKWPITSHKLPLKLLTSAMFCHKLIQVNQNDFMLRLTCVFLGRDFPIQLLLNLLSSAYYDRLVDHLHHVPIHYCSSLNNHYCTIQNFGKKLGNLANCKRFTKCLIFLSQKLVYS